MAMPAIVCYYKKCDRIKIVKSLDICVVNTIDNKLQVCNCFIKLVLFTFRRQNHGLTVVSPIGFLRHLRPPSMIR